MPDQITGRDDLTPRASQDDSPEWRQRIRDDTEAHAIRRCGCGAAHRPRTGQRLTASEMDALGGMFGKERSRG